MTVNLIQDREPENPSFETDVSGWSTSTPAYHMNSGATFDRVADSSQDGDYVGRLVMPGSSAAEGVAGTFGGITFSAGVAYTLSMRVKPADTVLFDLALGIAGADHANANYDSLSVGEWATITVTWTPASDQTVVYAVFRGDLGGTGAQAGTTYIDSVAVRGVYAATRYVKVGESLVEA